MYDEGEVHYHIGNVIIKNCIEGWIILHQTKYLASKLQEFGMFESNLSNTPLLVSVHFSKNDSPITRKELVATHDSPYFRVVGSLMHDIVNNLDDLNVFKCLERCLQNHVPLHNFIEKDSTKLVIFVQIVPYFNHK
jgi:hypothetical protein